MSPRLKPLLLAAGIAGALALTVHAAQRWPDGVPSPWTKASTGASTAGGGHAGPGVPPADPAKDRDDTLTASRAPTALEVGDVDSFGRELHWLGVKQMAVEIASTCTTPADPAAPCARIDPAVPVTRFDFQDVQRFVLPGGSAESLFCHWFSPVLTAEYLNPGAFDDKAWLSYTPTLTIENPVLDDPALIDPSTGLPFNGRMLVGVTGSEIDEVWLGAGQSVVRRDRDTAACIGGFVSQRMLVEGYGLSEAQARKFFRKSTTVRMNVRGSARLVSDAYLIFGMRIVGD